MREREDLILVQFTSTGKRYAYKAKALSGIVAGDIVALQTTRDADDEYEAAVVTAVLEYKEVGGAEETFIEGLVGRPIRPIVGKVVMQKWDS